MSEVALVDSFPLSPMQLGMVADQPISGALGLDVIQLDCLLEGDLDRAAFAAAWQWVTGRHGALRTCFRWDSAGQVRQDVHAHAELPWRVFGAPMDADAWENFLREDRAAGMPLDSPPLFRGALAPTADGVRFALTFHHSVMDGRSLVTLLREVFAYYDGLRTGQVPHLPEPPPFRAYIAWLAEHDPGTDEAFWRDLLRGLARPTILSDQPIADGSASTHPEHDIRLSPELSGELRALAQRCGLTLNTLMQGAWAILLSRYTGLDDVAFGAVRSIRRDTVAQADAIVGLLLNTVPVRARLDPDRPLTALLGDLRAQSVAVRDHHHAPLMQLQRLADVPAGGRLFDTLLVYENFLLHDTLRGAGGAWLRRSFRVLRQPNYPMVLQVFAEEAVLLKLLHHSATFSPEVVAGMGAQLRHLLQTMTVEPDCPVGRMSLLPPAERRRMLVEWNATASDYPRHRGVHDLATAQVAAAPDALAVASGDRRWSYDELDRWADRVSGELRSAGVIPDEVVAILAHPSPELVAAQLGILRSGATCLPLDPLAPPDRTATLLDRVKVGIAVADPSLADRLPDRVRVLHPDAGVPAVGAAAPPPPATDPERAAFILDTAGPSAEPCPVTIPHRALVNLVTWVGRSFGLGPTDRVAMAAVGSHEASVLEIWSALGAGASLHHPGAEAPVDPAWLGGGAVDVAFLAPVDAGSTVSELTATPGELRLVTVVGRALRGWRPTASFDLRYLAGPAVAGLPMLHGRAGAAARPIANIQAYLLDERAQPVPVGAVGELCLAGAGLAGGPLDRLASPERRAHPHPSGSAPPDQVLRGGEAAVYTADGGLELRGPAGLATIRGERLDAGAVAAVLHQHPSVADAVVAIDGSEAEQAIGAVMAQPGLEVPLDELRRLLADRLPHYRIAIRPAIVPAFPLTHNGRIDIPGLLTTVQATPEPHPAGGEAAGDLPGPLQLAIADVWAAVLGTGEDGRRSLLTGQADFFGLGGHSLFAVRAALRLSEQLTVDIPARLIFDAPTVSAFAREVERLREEAEAAPPDRIVPIPRQ